MKKLRLEDFFRDVSTRATSATVNGPILSDTLTLFKPGGRVQILFTISIVAPKFLPWLRPCVALAPRALPMMLMQLQLVAAYICSPRAHPCCATEASGPLCSVSGTTPPTRPLRGAAKFWAHHSLNQLQHSLVACGSHLVLRDGSTESGSCGALLRPAAPRMRPCVCAGGAWRVQLRRLDQGRQSHRDTS